VCRVRAIDRFDLNRDVAVSVGEAVTTTRPIEVERPRARNAQALGMSG
jgi:hypothetical protein